MPDQPSPRTQSATQIEAAARGHADRRSLKQRASWLSDLEQQPALTPRMVEGRDATSKAARPRALLGVDTRNAQQAARARVAVKEPAAPPPPADVVPKKAPVASSRPRTAPPPSRGRGTGRDGKGKGAASDEMSSRQVKLFVDKLILGPTIDRAAKQGEVLLAARRRQQEYENRPVPKPVFTGTMFASLPCRASADSVVGFMPDDGKVPRAILAQFWRNSAQFGAIPRNSLTAKPALRSACSRRPSRCCSFLSRSPISRLCASRPPSARRRRCRRRRPSTPWRPTPRRASWRHCTATASC